jgi:erythromycin esterase-like protein
MATLQHPRLPEAGPEVPDRLTDAIRELSGPLHGPADLDPLIDRIGDARYVLLGEASHGTHEYYAWRAEISRRLIGEKGFSFIAVEGDWPDCFRVNRYVKGLRDGEGDTARDARGALHAFQRWPTWMWANEEVAGLVAWLRSNNDRRPDGDKVGFYGLDVYSLWDSLYRVLAYLHRSAPDALPAARRALRCFEPYGEDEHEYARAARWVDETCEDRVVALLAEVRGLAANPPRPPRPPCPPREGDTGEAALDAEQNALVVRNAERYYRSMVRGGPESWNVRDSHMAETLDALMRRHGPRSKAIVWEHNTHIGDARFTDMAADGMVNVGQLVRESHAADGVVLVGFGGYRGSVIAGREWEAPPERMEVPPALPGSWEDAFELAGAGDRLMLTDAVRRDDLFLEERGQRAIGVVYRPESERFGNYVPTVLPMRYDAYLHLSDTQALHPLPDVTARTTARCPRRTRRESEAELPRLPPITVCRGRAGRHGRGAPTDG